jgi:diketogulonate reductase-like aldo/keto reductase
MPRKGSRLANRSDFSFVQASRWVSLARARHDSCAAADQKTEADDTRISQIVANHQTSANQFRLAWQLQVHPDNR